MASNKSKFSLFIFIDAFGWEILKKYPFLNDQLVTKEPLGTIWGYSATCIPSILTGKLPREHGHFSFFYYNPQESPFSICKYLSILPKSITRRGRVRRMMSKFIQKYYGYTGYFQIYNMPFNHISLFDYSEKRDLYQPGGINGKMGTIFDYLRENKIPFYLSDWRLKEEENIKLFEEALKKEEFNFAYLYFAEMDALLHSHGKDSPVIAEKVAWYEEKIKKIMDQIHEKHESVNLYIFSDHGMTSIIDQCDLIPKIESLGLSFGKDYAAVYDSTVARFWFLKPSAKEKIVNVLNKEPKGKILSEETLNEYGCDFPGNTYGELFFLMNPGVLLCPSFMGETMLAGMHGYDPYDKDSLAMFSGNVIPDRLPGRLDDMYELMANEAS